MLKWILFLSFLSVLVDAFSTVPGQCAVPRIAHGRPRWRSRSKLIKYICSPGYELVGSRYATCRNGQWDLPKPTCVKPGCPVPQLKNGLVIPSRSDAWLVFFCLPGFKLVGSTAMYCDGVRWNTTMPSCIDSTVSTKLTCDFESSDLCGWTQDFLHDFDWERLNNKTPSSFLFTGPSYDHTFGKGGSGYYMYIESSSRQQNETARLISPIFDMNLAKNGCFSFYYHMFGRDIGGLRVYQKPDDVPLPYMLKLPDDSKQKYIIFELWGNQGDTWYGDVSQLTDFGENFQIVIEGIRGRKFTSDIAVDDVAILQGEQCAEARKAISPPPAMLPETCEGRCGVTTHPAKACGCTLMCIINGDCCNDFMELCIDSPDATTEESDPISAELPQTQKLIGKTTLQSTTELETTLREKSPVATTITTIKTTPTTVITTQSTTTKAPTITERTTKATTTPKITKVTIFQKDAIVDKAKTEVANVTNPHKSVKSNVTRKIIIYKPTTTALPKNVTTKIVVRTTVKPTTVTSTSTVKTTKFVRYTAPTTEKSISAAPRKLSKPAKSSAWKPVLITFAVLMCLGGVAWLAVGARSARGRAALAGLRARTRHDPEVRYLHADTDDE